MMPVVAPKKVVQAISLLLDAGIALPPDGTGSPTIPLDILDRPDLGDKLRGLNLSAHLQPAGTERKAVPSAG